MNKRGNWTLAAVLGVVGICGIIFPLMGLMQKWWIIIGILFIYLAFKAN